MKHHRTWLTNSADGKHENIRVYPIAVRTFLRFDSFEPMPVSTVAALAALAFAALLSILDAFVILLASHEYRLLRKHLPTH